MTGARAFKALSLVATIGVLVISACTIQLRGRGDPPQSPKAEQTTDATSSDLARCRSVTAEEAADYQHCKQVWAGNRRRFFGVKDGASVSGHDDAAAGVEFAPKDQSRVLQRYLTTPEASKP